MKRSISKILKDCKNELDDINSIIQRQGPFHKTTPYLIRYSIIRACGTIEVAFKSIVSDYFNKSKIPQIHNYLDKTVRNNSRNPSYENMCSLLKNFDATWHAEFKRKIKSHRDKSRLLSSLDSLNLARNEFAHGKVSFTISINQVINYYDDTVELLKVMYSCIY